MTNREWLNSLTDDELVEWLTNEHSLDWNTMKPRKVSPTLNEIMFTATSSSWAIQQWLKEERVNYDKRKDN